MVDSPFDCQLCKVCCTGEGGIYFKDSELKAAADLVGLSKQEFISRHLKRRGEVWEVRCDSEGVCTLLGKNGCTVHLAKPEICRLWPFFPGMLNDQDALDEAKEGCPGIHSEATCAEMRRYYEQTQQPDKDKASC
jgi:Fe-S-cluster containining protein